jgi:hypothetical protein
VDLTAAIQRASEQSVKTILASMGLQPGAAPVVANPMDQFAQMERMMTFMSALETRAMETVERRMGVQTNTESGDEGGWMKTLGTFGELALEFFRNRKPAAPDAAPQAPPPPAVTPPPIVGKMSEAEKQAIFPALGMLKPFLPRLQKLAGENQPDRAVAESLEGYIPDAMAPALAALADLTDVHGVDALALLGPDFQTPRWLGILRELRTVLTIKYGGEDGPED